MDRSILSRSRWLRYLRMEAFVRRIVAGGVTLLAGLWISHLTGAWWPGQGLGFLIALIGALGLFSGIRRPLEFD